MEERVLRYNRKAMVYLNKSEYNNSFLYLTKAQKFLRGMSLSSCAKLMGITLNNFGCYYKSINDPEKARLYLTQALEVEKNNLTEVNNLAATHLNLCAIESQMGFHMKALENSLKAINLLRNLYKTNEKLASTFVIAHYNAGMEYKALLKTAESHKILEIGLEISKEFLGKDSYLTTKIEKTLASDYFFDKINTSKLSPLRSIRSSTAATTKKRFKYHIDKSNEVLSNVSRYSKGRISPFSYTKRFRDTLVSSINTANEFSLKKSKISPKRQKKFRKKKKRLDKSFQADLGLKLSEYDLKYLSAVKIQKT